MTFALPKITRILWQIRITFLLVVAQVLIVVFWRFSPNILLPTIIALAIGSVFVLWYISYYFKKYTITIDKSNLYITKGVVFRTVIIIPCMRLAFIKSFTTPITYRLNLRCILLKVARGWVFLPELKSENVKSIIKMVKK